MEYVLVYSTIPVCKPVVLPDLAKLSITPSKIEVQNKQLMLIWCSKNSLLYYYLLVIVNSIFTIYIIIHVVLLNICMKTKIYFFFQGYLMNRNKALI